MGNFKISAGITLKNEGYLSNNPDDHGKLTWAGIASAYWPHWKGWPIINDAIEKNTVSSLKYNHQLSQLVEDFYKINFWDVNRLDDINDQQLCDSIFDFGVNSGIGRAADFLQQVARVTIDGVIGPHTIAAVNAADPETMYNAYNELRRAFYNRLAVGDQAQFLHSWLSRLTPYKA